MRGILIPVSEKSRPVIETVAGSDEEGQSLDNRGEVCLEEEVERRGRSGMSAGEIADDMSVDPVWVESLISAFETPAADDGPEKAGA